MHTLNTNMMEEEEEAERQRQVMKQKREEQLAVYLLTASPIIITTPYEDPEGRLRIERMQREKAEARMRVMYSLVALCLIRILKPDTLIQTLKTLLAPEAGL